MTYTETTAPLRTDVSFANWDDEDHHKGVSPLTQIQIGMVSQIPLPDIIIDGHQFKKMNTGKYILKTNFEDSCVRIQGKFSLVKSNVLSSEGEIYIVYQCFQETDTFFSSPLEPKLLGIVKISNLEDNVQIVKLDQVEAKCVIFPYKFGLIFTVV